MPGTPIDSVHSPANDLSGGFNVGGGSTPAKPSVHSPCDFDRSGDSGAAVGAKFGDADARTPVSLDEVQLAEGIPEASQGQMGQSMIGDLDKALPGGR